VKAQQKLRSRRILSLKVEVQRKEVLLQRRVKAQQKLRFRKVLWRAKA